MKRYRDRIASFWVLLSLTMAAGMAVKTALKLESKPGYSVRQDTPNNPHIFNLRMPRIGRDTETQEQKTLIRKAFEADGDYVVMVIDKFSPMQPFLTPEAPALTDIAFSAGKEMYEFLEACKARTGKKLIVYIPGNVLFAYQIDLQYVIAAGNIISVDPQVVIPRLGYWELLATYDSSGKQVLGKNSSHKAYLAKGSEEVQLRYVNWRLEVLDAMEEEIYAAYSRRALANDLAFPREALEELPIFTSPAKLLETHGSSLSLFDYAQNLDEFCVMAAAIGIKGFEGNLQQDRHLFADCIKTIDFWDLLA